MINATIVGIPLDLGAENLGVDIGPNAIRYQNITEKLENSGFKISDVGNISCTSRELLSIGSPKLKYLDEILRVSELAAKIICDLVNKKQKIIATLRSAKFGGLFKGEEKERIPLLSKAIELGADFIDVEFGSTNIPDIIKNKKSSKIIISHHDFKGTPAIEKLESIYNQINKSKPDMVKIVTTANSINDNFVIFGLLKNKGNLIARLF